jgi:hypothetical protein
MAQLLSTITRIQLAGYGLGNLAAAGIDQLTAIIKNRLQSIQYRPALIEGSSPRPGTPSNQNPRRPQPSHLL